MDSLLAAIMLGLVVTPAMGNMRARRSTSATLAVSRYSSMMFPLQFQFMLQQAGDSVGRGGVNQRVTEFFVHDAASEARENAHVLIARSVFVQG